MGNVKSFAGLLGLVLSAFGVLGSFIEGSFTHPVLLAHMLLGAALLSIWFFTSGVKKFSSNRSTGSTRGIFAGASALISTALFITLLVAVNYLASRHDKRWDLTEQQVYSLASQSTEVVEQLKEPLKIVAFKTEDLGRNARSDELLKLYVNANPANVSYQSVDPRAQPHLVDIYEMKAGNFVYLEYGDKRGTSRLNEVSEESVTNAIIKLTRGAARKIYFVAGHDEPDLASALPTGIENFVSALKDEQYAVGTLFLPTLQEVPDDAAAVIVIGPKKNFSADERSMLVRFVERGGRLALFTDPRAPADARQIAAKFGIDITDSVVIDQVQRIFAGPALGIEPVITSYGVHPITKNFNNQTVSIFIGATALRKADQADKRATYVELAMTSETSWGETDLVSIFDSESPSATFDPTKDVTSPVVVAMSFEKKYTSANSTEDESAVTFDSVGRLVVFGDSEFVRNGYIVQYSNRDLALNAVGWLVGEEGGISLRPKSIRASVAPITTETFRTMLLFSLLVPELILIFGLFIWWRRKQRSVTT